MELNLKPKHRNKSSPDLKDIRHQTVGSKKQTCLETRLEHVSWNRNSPVKDPGHPSSKQHAGNAELTMAAGKRRQVQQALR